MMRRFAVLVVMCTFGVFCVKNTHAIYPDNNIYGMSLATADPAEIAETANLVNSNGAEWGYITLVIQENDRSVDKWQSIFDTLKSKKLIPIIRLATKPEGSNWRKPTKEDASAWVDFLDDLEWPVYHRYVVLFNEPNHGTEWGGKVYPEEYGEVAESFARQLKEKNAKFFVMLAGFDSAAPVAEPMYLDQSWFLDRMFTTFPVNKINQYIDGWASHSYPNPGFRGKPTDTGRNTIRNYQWELSWLAGKSIKSLPVYITETGWPRSSYDETTIAEYMKTAYREVWMKDNRVKAVTPFIYSYIGGAFESWSWKKPSGGGYYAVYSAVQAMPKIAGNPVLSDGTAKENTTVYRFWSERQKTHFFSLNSNERSEILAKYPNAVWRIDTIAYKAKSGPETGLVPVYRFYSKNKGTHFFTIYENEKNEIIAKYPSHIWRYEHIAYYVRPNEGNTSGPEVHRFWNTTTRRHFFTTSIAERDSLLAQSATGWRYEGVAWKSVE